MDILLQFQKLKEQDKPFANVYMCLCVCVHLRVGIQRINVSSTYKPQITRKIFNSNRLMGKLYEQAIHKRTYKLEAKLETVHLV